MKQFKEETQDKIANLKVDNEEIKRAIEGLYDKHEEIVH